MSLKIDFEGQGCFKERETFSWLDSAQCGSTPRLRLCRCQGVDYATRKGLGQALLKLRKILEKVNLVQKIGFGVLQRTWMICLNTNKALVLKVTCHRTYKLHLSTCQRQDLMEFENKLQQR